jgi:hypothetical protein
MKCMDCDKEAQCWIQTGPKSRKQKKNTDEYVQQIVGFQFKPKLSAVLAVLNGSFRGLSLHSEPRKHNGNNHMVRHNNRRQRLR